MKNSPIFAFLLLVLLNCSPLALCQQHLDITFEGPWLFYQERAFVLNSTGTTITTGPALIAIAPIVLGHFPPTFSTGDGFQIAPAGIYCVGFEGVCSMNNLTTLPPGDYPPAGLVPVNKPAGWDWRALTSAYVLILPMPNSDSADGQYPMTLHATFPTPATPSPVTSSGAYALGTHLHYPNGPKTISLLACPAAPTAATCKTTSWLPLSNSGTLRISIKSDENPAASDACDYHARRAYHKMIHLLDDSLSANGQNAYINVPTYDTCAQCDPQQAMIPSDCTGMGMASTMDYFTGDMDIPVALANLVSLLEQLGFRKDQVALGELSEQSIALTEKSPVLSQLHTLKTSLETSTDGIDLLLDAKVATLKMAPAAPRPQDLRTVLQKEEALSRAIERAMHAATSGKDCRAAEMLIQ
jgi:hypothetical protein